jgi:hypothetical protein
MRARSGVDLTAGPFGISATPVGERQGGRRQPGDEPRFGAGFCDEDVFNPSRLFFLFFGQFDIRDRE